MFIDNNGQTWVYTNSDALWNTYRTAGLKQGPLEKRCGDDLKVIDVSDANLEETKFAPAPAPTAIAAAVAAAVITAPQPEPTENSEAMLQPTDIKTEPLLSEDDDIAYIVEEFSKDRLPRAPEASNHHQESQANVMLYPTEMKQNDFWYQKPDEQLHPEASILNRSEMFVMKSPQQQAAGKTQAESLSSYRIKGFSNHTQTIVNRSESSWQNPVEQMQPESQIPNRNVEQTGNDIQSDVVMSLTSVWKAEHQASEEQPKSERALEGNDATGLSNAPSGAKPQTGQKRPLRKFRIEGSSCTACAQGFPDKKKLRLHLSCHKRTKSS